MLKPYHAFRAVKRAQRELKALYYRALRLYWKSERLYRVRTLNSYKLQTVSICTDFPHDLYCRCKFSVNFSLDGERKHVPRRS